MRIGVYVGCFNPIHNIHLKIAEHFLKNNLLDKVAFVPAGDSYEKKGLAGGFHRLNMIRLATAHNPALLVSDIEIQHKKLSTFKTLSYFKSEYPNDEICLIMGTDNLKELYWWENAKNLIENFKIFVLTRNDMTTSDFPEYANNKNIIFVDFNIKMSATSVRNDFEVKNFKQAKSKLNTNVFQYILKNKLYGTDELWN